MTTTAQFLPSLNGFAFTNAWPSEPAVVLHTPFGEIHIGNAAGGLCGGMVFAALDYWHAAIVPPTVQPGPSEPLYGYIVRRLIESWHLPVGITQYYQWMNLPDGDTGFDVLGRHVVIDRGLAWRTIQVQWPQIKADLDAGTPVPLGVVTGGCARLVTRVSLRFRLSCSECGALCCTNAWRFVSGFPAPNAPASLCMFCIECVRFVSAFPCRMRRRIPP